MALDENDYLKNQLKKDIVEAKEKEAYYLQVLHELNTEERYAHFLKPFPRERVEEFKKDYARQRVYWHFNKNSHSAFRDRLDNRYFEYCQIALKRIQDRKLFNAISLWASKQLDVAGIEVSYDWGYWTRNPINCPHISPISKEDIEVYIQFLQQADFDFSVTDNHYSVDLFSFEDTEQEFGALRWEGELADDSFFGPWFRFYDHYYNTRFYKDLPGTRMNEEQRYIWIYRDWKNAQAPKSVTQEAKPKIFYHSEKEKLFELFEDKETKELYRSYKEMHEGFWFADSIEMDAIYLTEAKELIPIEYHDDWREGVKIACEKYHREMTIYLIWGVYQEYKNKLAANDSFEDWGVKPSYYFKIREEAVFEMIEGRKLVGEPANLDFLK